MSNTPSRWHLVNSAPFQNQKQFNKIISPQILGREMCGIHNILLTCIHNNDELRRATPEENGQLSKHATQPVTTQCYICLRVSGW